MRWEVVGADTKTGLDVAVVLEAADRMTAEAVAVESGIIVSAVRVAPGNGYAGAAGGADDDARPGFGRSIPPRVARDLPGSVPVISYRTPDTEDEPPPARVTTPHYPELLRHTESLDLWATIFLVAGLLQMIVGAVIVIDHNAPAGFVLLGAGVLCLVGSRLLRLFAAVGHAVRNYLQNHSRE